MKKAFTIKIPHSAKYKTTLMPVTTYLIKIPGLVRPDTYRSRLMSVFAGTFIAVVPVVAEESNDQIFQLAAFGDSPEAFEMDSRIPEVLTTTRLRQPKSRVPGTTTIITGEMIRDLGIMNLVEVFRLVPGMTVAEVGSNNPVTSYHGTVHYEQRRLQVQVDGRTSYRPNLSDMDWNTMPVPLELIERIEVSRGPNSAAYGINAFLGTINIITRAPEDTAGVETRAITGSRGYKRVFGSAGNVSGDYNWRLAYEKRKSDGFDEQVDDDIYYPFHDGYDINTFNYDSSLFLNSQYSLDLRGGVVDGVNEEDQIKNGKLGADDHPDIIVDDYYLQTRLNVTTSENHFYHVQASFQNYDRRQRWSICIPGDTFNNILQGNSFDLEPCTANEVDPFRANLNEDIEESRLEFEIQDTLLFNRDLKLVSGLGYRKDTYRSETYFNGRGNNYQSQVFANLEYSPLRWLTLNAGGNWEKPPPRTKATFHPGWRPTSSWPTTTRSDLSTPRQYAHRMRSNRIRTGPIVPGMFSHRTRFLKGNDSWSRIWSTPPRRRMVKHLKKST